MTQPLQPGDKAPDFRATAVGGKYGDGETVALEQLCGRPVVLYFYPKDDTPGCTTQACGLRDAWDDFDGRVEVFGVSVDFEKSHQKFISKYQLPFPLLSDHEKKIVSEYGVWWRRACTGRSIWALSARPL